MALVVTIEDLKKEFEELIKQLDDNYEKSIKKRDTLDKLINELTGSEKELLLRGNKKALADFFENYISIQTQIQSNIKDKISVKKLIYDIANRNKEAETDNKTLGIMRLLEEYARPVHNDEQNTKSPSNLDKVEDLFSTD